MSTTPAVIVDNVHKSFVLPQSKQRTLKQVFVNIFNRQKPVSQQALRGISFTVNEGDFFGVVGRNGSGKSTLLKMLAGVYQPTSGAIHINGELTPFIELGVGFNPELSGRDNVFLNGALLGFTRKQMEAMYDEIVDFAELEEFMGQKLKNYSSGMHVRLAFSIAVKAKNPILIFDEVLAVGDEAFQRKCLDVFEQYKAEKQTVILVTHDMETVRKFCNRAMLISDGQILEQGDPRAVAAKYSELNQKSVDNDTEKQNKNVSGAKFLRAKITDANGKKQPSFNVGDKVIVHMTWHGLDASMIESIGINIFKRSGEHVTGINSRTGDHSKGWKARGTLSIEFSMDLSPGKYNFLIEAFQDEGKLVDAIRQGLQFTIKNQRMEWSGLIQLEHKWHDE